MWRRNSGRQSLVRESEGNTRYAKERVKESNLLLNLDFPSFNEDREELYAKVVKLVRRGDRHFDNQSEHVRHRTHTAILYLNEGFEGGLTRFKETEFGPFREVQPQPGTLLAFDATKNAHAVSKLVTGKRYVMNMWFSTRWRVYRRHRKIFKPL